MGLSQEELPYIKVPLHTLIKLTPMAYGCEEERFPVPIPAVDTHRPKPARRNTGDNPAPMTTGEKASGAAPARDYFGDAAPTATAQVMDTSTKGTDDAAQSDSEPDPSGTTKMSAEKARQSILLEHAEAHGKKASETTQEEAGISQADIARALQVQSTIGTRQPVRLTKFSDLPAESAEGALCAPVAAASSKKYNRHKMYCPRPECQSVILSPGTADWVVDEGGMLSDDPSSPFGPDPKADSTSHSELRDPAVFWHVGGVPMVFENIGFTRNVPTAGEVKPGLKWLICAECELGPLGWCYEGETEAWLSPSRLTYAT